MPIEEDRREVKNPESRSKSHPGRTTRLADFALALQLVDLWKLHHLADREFTHHSHAHNSLSRIDFFSIIP